MKVILNNSLLLSVALLARVFFLVYKMLAWLLLPASVLLIGGLIWGSLHGSWIGIVLIALLAFSASGLYRYTNSSFAGAVVAGKPVSRMSDHFIAWIGTLKYFSSPFCMVEDPGSYKISGANIRHLLDEGVLQAGDILLRGYKGYIDGELIRRTGGAHGAGCYFSHAALYVGPLDNIQDKALAASCPQVMGEDGKWREANAEEKESFRNNPAFFQAGKQMVIHSMSRGVHVEDILTFLRCDYLAVLRLPEQVEVSDDREHTIKPQGDGPTSESGAAAIDEKLRAGASVPRAEIVANARLAGLERIGSGYDFMFKDCRTFHRFSCSEFVYYCFKSVHRYIGLKPKRHTMAGLFARSTISPPDIFAACGSKGKLALVWTNAPQDNAVAEDAE